MKMLASAEGVEPLKWRFYHASHTPDVGYLDLDGTVNESLQVEDVSLVDQVNGDLGTMHHSGLVDYDFSAGRASPRGPVKASHDLSMMFPDTDSGFGSYKSRSRLIEDFSPTLSRLPRSRSLSRLNGLTTQEMTEVLQEKPVRHIQTQLEDSEARRTVLMHKLKEAQATLELQNDRLSKIENSAKDNTVMVEDLKFKEREYRKKIAQLQVAEEEKQMLQLENVRLREEMQDRIDTLDFQLKTLKNQHQSTEESNERRVSLLDQTTVALSLLEEENTKLQQDRDKLREEMGLMKEAFQLSKSRYDSLEEEHKSQKTDTERFREENLSLNKRVHEMAGQMMELRSLLQAVKDDNERLSTSWKSASEDKHRASRQVEGYQDTLADLKSRLAAAVADKDRLFQERLDLNHKVQQLILEKEHVLKSQMVLEEQIGDQQKALEKTQHSSSRHDNQKKYLEEELSAVKRVSEDLSTELASIKAFYERALEQLSLAENGKKLQEQQLHLAEQERKRLQGEVDRLSQILDGRHRDDRTERQHLEDTILKMRSEMKDLKYDKDQLTKKTHELEAKLNKANDEIRGGIGKQHNELESWKTTCDRLTASVTRKETELQNLSDKCRSLENQLSRVQDDLRHSREKEEISTDFKEDLQRLQDENRCLLQEKAENEQMLQLLETQRDVLTKSTESSLNKLQNVEQLSGKVDQMRNENELLRQRILELEKVRDKLIKEKEELLASSELIYKSQGLEELEGKMEELREANKQLRDINDVMSSKLQIVEQENLRLKHAVSDNSSKEELKRLREENKRLLDESNKVRRENQNYTSQTNRDAEASGKEFQKVRKERDALQKQVQLINGQLSLLEGSKKRSDDTAQRAQDELSQLRSQLETSRKECTEAKRVATQVKSLSEQLQKAKDQQESQEKLIRSMKEELEEERSKKPARIQESLEDVGAELQQMSGELHKLLREIENKEQTIESLEKELRTAKDTADTKEHTVNDLKKLVSDLEDQNATLKTGLDLKQTDTGEHKPSFVVKTAEKSLKEELEEAVKSKQAEEAAKQEEQDRLAKAAEVKSDSSDKTAASQPPASRPTLRLTTSTTTDVSKTSSPPPPLHVPSTPADTSDTSMDKSPKCVISPEGYPLTSTPNQPGQPVKQFNFGSEIKTAGSADTDLKPSSMETKKDSVTSAAGISANEGKDPATPLLSFSTDPTKRTASQFAASKSPFGEPKEFSGDSRSKTPHGKDAVDFPPLTPVDQTKPKLAFSRPHPATKNKPRKLPEIRMPVNEETTTTAIAKKTAELEAGRKSSQVASDVGKKVDIIRQKLQVPTAPKVPAAKAPKAKTSPRESRKTFISRRELTGQTSKLLSDSGVTVITTRTGSSPNTTLDVKQYVVKKQDTPSEKKPGDSSAAGSSLKSFEELLGGDGDRKSPVSSGFVSGDSDLSKKHVSTSQSSDKSGSKTSSEKTEHLEASRARPYSSSSITSRKAQLLSQPTTEQWTFTKPAVNIQTKSSSIKDFLASFSAPVAGKMEEEKGGVKSGGDSKSAGSVQAVRPLFSRLSGSKDGVSSNQPGFSAKKSPSLDSFEALLDDPVVQEDGSDKEKEAESTLATGSTFGSSLASGDPWSFLLDDPAAQSTAQVGKVDKPKSSIVGKAEKVREPVGKVRGMDQKETSKGSLSSTSLLSTGGSTGSVTRQSLEEGQPLKFRPATGLFLSKSLGHPISASVTSSSQSQPASGETGNSSLHHGRYGSMFFHKPDKPGTESGDRLQSLISKYRSHSTDPVGRPSSPVTGVKPRGSSSPPTVRAGQGSPRGRGFSPGSPRAPLLRLDSTSSSDKSEDTAPKTGKKLPPPPPPKPGKSLMKSLSVDGGARAEAAGQSGEMLDSQEQSDINALIQKAGGETPPTKSLLSVHPPKITSTSKFLKCKREQRK